MEPPRRGFFQPETAFPKIVDTAIFQTMSFRRELDAWVTYLERYLKKVVQMDYTNHIGFR